MMSFPFSENVFLSHFFIGVMPVLAWGQLLVQTVEEQDSCWLTLSCKLNGKFCQPIDWRTVFLIPAFCFSQWPTDSSGSFQVGDRGCSPCPSSLPNWCLDPHCSQPWSNMEASHLVVFDSPERTFWFTFRDIEFTSHIYAVSLVYLYFTKRRKKEKYIGITDYRYNLEMFLQQNEVKLKEGKNHSVGRNISLLFLYVY